MSPIIRITFGTKENIFLNFCKIILFNPVMQSSSFICQGAFMPESLSEMSTRALDKREYLVINCDNIFC